MGLIPVKCRSPGCERVFMWFTGGAPQLCGQCYRDQRQQEQPTVAKVEYDPSKYSDLSVVESIQQLCTDLNKALKVAAERRISLSIQIVPDAELQMQQGFGGSYPRTTHLQSDAVLKLTSAVRHTQEKFL